MAREEIDRPAEEVKLRQAISQALLEQIFALEITAYELLKRAGLSQATGRNILAGESTPKFDAVLALEKGLGVEPGWLSKRVSELMTTPEPMIIIGTEAVDAAKKKKKK